MNRKVLYTSPTTGLVTKSANAIADPKFESRYSGSGMAGNTTEEIFLVTDDTTRPYSYELGGAERNRMDGGPFVPNGALQGHEAYLSAAVSIGGANFNVLAHQNPEGEQKLVSNGWYIIGDRRVDPHDMMTVFSDTTVNAEVIQLGTVTADTNPIPLNGATTFTKAHPAYSVVQPIVMLPASYNLATGEVGYKYSLERPSAPTIASVADGGTQTIDLTFNALESSEVGVKAYVVSVLKKGQALSLYGPPVSVPEYVLPAEKGATELVLALDSGDLSLSSGVYTLAGISKYYSTATGALAAITAGTYYVLVWAATSTSRNDELRLSPVAVSDAVVVA